MSRFIVNESSKEAAFIASSISGTTERNRFVTWESAVRIASKPAIETLSPKTSMTHGLLRLACKIIRSIVEALLKALYRFLKFSYEIAKFFTKGLSSIRRYLFVAQ